MPVFTSRICVQSPSDSILREDSRLLRARSWCRNLCVPSTGLVDTRGDFEDPAFEPALLALELRGYAVDEPQSPTSVQDRDEILSDQGDHPLLEDLGVS